MLFRLETRNLGNLFLISDCKFEIASEARIIDLKLETKSPKRRD